MTKSLLRRLTILALSSAAAIGQKPTFTSSTRLEELTQATLAAAVERFGKGGLAAEKIALTVIDLA